MRGVVAAGHPLTAEAGAQVLRDGGNAVDAAVGAVLMSFMPSRRSPGQARAASCSCTRPRARTTCSTSSSALPAAGWIGPIRRRSRRSASTSPTRRPALQHRPVVVRGLRDAEGSGGGAPALRVLALGDADGRAGARRPRGGGGVPMQAYLFQILDPIMAPEPEGRAIYPPDGRLVRAGDVIRLPELGDLLDRLGAEGPDFLYTGDVAAAVSDWVLERGGLLSGTTCLVRGGRARAGARPYRGREVITNPPPSSGGILIADALDLLERLGRPCDPRVIAEVIEERTGHATRSSSGWPRGLPRAVPGKQAIDRSQASCIRGSATPPTSRSRRGGACASVTCSNGSCSGVVVPGTGIHLNNMLGEQDLNPRGYHRHAPGPGCRA